MIIFAIAAKEVRRHLVMSQVYHGRSGRRPPNALRPFRIGELLPNAIRDATLRRFLYNPIIGCATMVKLYCRRGASAWRKQHGQAIDSQDGPGFAAVSRNGRRGFDRVQTSVGATPGESLSSRSVHLPLCGSEMKVIAVIQDAWPSSEQDHFPVVVGTTRLKKSSCTAATRSQFRSSADSAHRSCLANVCWIQSAAASLSPRTTGT